MENFINNEKNENNNESGIKFNNSIELLNELEKIYIYPKDNSLDNFTNLNNYKMSEKTEPIKVINSIPTTSLSSLIFKKGTIITAIAVKSNSIYIGTNKGEIRAYSWKTEKKLNFYISSEISREIKKDVICMDITDNNKALVAGHLNGYIILWDIDTSDCKKLITDEFYNQISAIKFTLSDKSFYEFLASDNKGTVKRISVSEGFFYNSVNSSKIIEYNKSISVIEILKLTEEQKNIVIKYNNRTDQEELLIVAFGSSDKIFITQIEPEIKNLYTFNKPQYIRYSFSPDICFGQGRIPAPFVYDGDFSEEINKKINIKRDLNINILTELNLNKEYQLIYISWGKILHIFILSFDLNDFLSINQIGYYINNEPIIRMGLLSNNIIYLMDIYKKFKIINTSFSNSGEIKIDPQGNVINKNSYESELCPEFNLDYTILFQSYFNDNNTGSDSIYKSSYNNLVFTQDKSFFIACKRYIYIGVLLNWEQCINELFKSSKKLEAFKLCINIYHGNNKILDGIPIKVKDRKENVKRVLKGLILQLILNIINMKNIFFGKEESKEILTKCLNMAIELCLDVGEIDFLFKEILKIMEEKGYFDFFMEKIRPFILKNKITSKQLGQNVTLKMLKYYMNLNDYGTMSRIIININDDNFDIKEIKDACVEKNLIFPLIYIYFQFYEENLFSLVLKLYESFNKANNMTRVEYEEYKNIIISKKIEPKNEIIKSKQYLGQKLLWLINLCLRGKKYPKVDLIKNNIYENLVQNIFLWLTNDEIIINLLNFDSFTFFYVYSNFYTEPNILSIIKRINKETKISSEINIDKNNLDKFDIKNINENIINKAISLDNILIQDDLNEYILKINCNEQILSLEHIIKTIKYILNFKDFQKKREDFYDYYEYHTKILNNEKIELYSLLINSVIENYKKEIGNEALRQILYIAEKNEFPLVAIKIYEILNENIKCLDIFLTSDKVRDKEEKIFLFIDEFMTKYVNSELQKYKNELIKRIDKLIEINVEKSFNISLKWLNNDQLKIIEKIPMKNGKKLNYIERYLNYYNSSSNSSSEGEENKKEKDKNFNKILITYFEILCKLNKKEDIIKLVKENMSCIHDDFLKICLKNEISEASIYIYIKQEKYVEAYKICKKEINKIFDNLIQVYSDENSKNKLEKISKYDELINQIFFICEKENRQKVWFDAFEFLFNKLIIVNSKEEKEKQNLTEIKSKISNNINDLIIKMHSYINIKNFIEEFSKKPQIAEFKSFNKILYNCIKEYQILQKIYEDILSIYSYQIDDKFKRKKKLINEGIFYEIKICDFCQKLFRDEDTFILYKCGHILHRNDKCCLKNNECKICNIENEKETIGSLDIEKNDTFQPKKENNINNKEKIEFKNKEEKKDSVKDIYDKLNIIDKFYVNRKSNFDRDVERIQKKANK